jgi:UDP-N-acetylmuramoyl-L-alanyl-D-glutamate--2,6-diaminopimelate ligase
MNKLELINTLTHLIVSRNDIKDSGELNNITTNLQGAGTNDVVFYKINPHDTKSVENFNKRMSAANPGLLILNHGAEFVKSANCIFIDGDHFLAAQKILLDKIFPNESKLKIVGVTGTNGKTTTVNLAMQIASMTGHKAFSVGTIGVFDIDGAIYPDLESTTPSYVEFRKLIHKFQSKYEVCFVEVSSHALVQNRLFDLELDAAAWTSFSQDHLDYHQSMEEYFKAKLLIEKKYLKSSKALILPALEQELYEKILKAAPDTRVKIAKTLGQRGFGQTLAERPLFYHSSYNQSNVELAFELNADLFGEKGLLNIKLADIKTPLGRFSVIELENNNLAIIDYAHTPDALINISKAIKNAFPNHSLTVVFGCGGNRDRTKRPLMGKAVASLADKVIVTSDNPRDEAPEDIIVDVIAGIDGDYEAIVDRKKAILGALEDADENEIILVAGKGHEEYQEIKGIKHPFSDFNIVKEFITGK